MRIGKLEERQELSTTEKEERIAISYEIAANLKDITTIREQMLQQGKHSAVHVCSWTNPLIRLSRSASNSAPPSHLHIGFHSLLPFRARRQSRYELGKIPVRESCMYLFSRSRSMRRAELFISYLSHLSLHCLSTFSSHCSAPQSHIPFDTLLSVPAGAAGMSFVADSFA